jgi:hypothetical protein
MTEAKMTVREALNAEADSLKAHLDVARRRLEQAAALVDLAKSEDRPGRLEEIHTAGEALGMAHRVACAVGEALFDGVEDSPEVSTALGFAFDRLVNAQTVAEHQFWEPRRIEAITLAELQAALAADWHARKSADTPAPAPQPAAV